MTEWVPPKRLQEMPTTTFTVLESYPKKYINTTINTVYNIPLINTTRQNYIPHINYSSFLNNETIEEIADIVKSLE